MKALKDTAENIVKYFDLSVQTDEMEISFRWFVQLSSQTLRLLRLISEFKSDGGDSLLYPSELSFRRLCEP
jgi:hypothetical protein